LTRAFDRRLGDDFLETVPRAPGVYRVLDTEGVVVYVGKAVNLRRRLSQYRNATRRKKHRKMREIVKSAASVTFEACASELDAELREAALIEELRPRWNVAGAFSFLYPSIGLGVSERKSLQLAFSTAPGERPELAWHGAFRSREITGGAFFGLVRLAAMLGHREKAPMRPRGTRTWLFEVRQLPPGWSQEWSAFLRGESRAALSALVVALLDKPRARRDAVTVQEDIDALERFYKHEALRLADARRRVGETRWPVPQAERDALFIRARAVYVPPTEPFDRKPLLEEDVLADIA
jgi:excinuclease ABC subunit C